METVTMKSGLKERKHDLIERVAERIRDRLKADRARWAEPFARQFYEHVPPQDLASATTDAMYGAALSLWWFAQTLNDDEPRVRVYNPQLDDHGWTSSHTVVEIVNQDMPFLVDSISSELSRFKADVHVVIHPILHVERGKNGRITALREPGEEDDGTRTESWMHVQISEQPRSLHKDIQEGIERTLNAVKTSVEDWPALRARCQDLIQELRQDGALPVPKEEVAEAASFLDWVDDNNYTFLGYREYVYGSKGEAFATPVAESGLGILRDPRASVFSGLRMAERIPPHIRDVIKQPVLLRITKANRRSRVHRPVYMDTIAIKSFDAQGNVKGERFFVGLFTSSAYSASPPDIPVLRQKVDYAFEQAGFQPASHNGKVLRHILETYPRDELFQMTREELYDIALGVLHLQERQRIAVFVRRDPFERFVVCMVYVPRERLDTSLRRHFQQILVETFAGRASEYYTRVSDAPLARVRFVIQVTPGHIPQVDIEALQQRLAEAGRAWGDRLKEALIENRGEERGIACFRRFDGSFSAAYRDRFNEDQAVQDISRIETALAANDLAINLYRPIESQAHELRVKIYAAGDRMPLSEILPMLENMGLLVKSEEPFEVCPIGFEQPVWIRDFDVATRHGRGMDLGHVKDVFQDAFTAVWHGEVEDDGFNQLVMRARLTARQVSILRAYAKYLRQAQIPFSQDYMEQTLAEHGELARLLVELFESRFDPSGQGMSKQTGESLVRQIEKQLESVENLDDDRIIRRFLNIVQVTLRTNYYQMGADGAVKPYISLKLDSRRIDELPLPRPFREIWVYSPRVEAVHLRGGKVARGGIRWSDRREDFRTEVLGLMKAQMVKNTVIVPVGSKGGFFVKQPARGTLPNLREEVVECYKTMMRGLLDLTDNLQGDETVPPRHVVRYDDDDPYLVIAADKGTATFSDIANERLRGLRLLARRRVRLRRLGRLRPQAHGHHCPRRLGVGQAPLPRDGQGHPERGLHGPRHRRHGWRRLWQRHAAVEAHPLDRGVQPPAHLLRSGPGRGGELRRARAALHQREPELVRVRRQADLGGRRHLRTLREVDQGDAADEGALPRRRRARHAGRAHQGDVACPRRADLVRRHRHVRAREWRIAPRSR